MDPLESAAAGGRAATATIIAVGTELLTPSRLDTNSLFITERLNEIGIEVRLKLVVGDDREELAAALRHAIRRTRLVLTTGGLGPTDDDLTRDVAAQVLSRPLAEDPSIASRIRSRFESRGLRMPEINRRQAMVPEGAVPLANPNGTAPGLWIEHAGGLLALLPGPPREMRPMLGELVATRLAGLAAGEVLVRRVLKTTGLTESHVEEVMQPLYERWRGEAVPLAATILASPGQIELHLSARAATPQEAGRHLARAAEEVVSALGAAVFTTEGVSLEAVVGERLRARRWRLAVAESCTGGLLLSRLTDVAGSSEYVERGFVTYSNASKIELLGVSEPLIREHGAVSEPVAAAMARGARERAGTDVGVGLTGIAGPGGATPAKPVGTVAVAVDTGSRPGGRVKTFHFLGGREQVKWQASQAALDMLRRSLAEP